MHFLSRSSNGDPGCGHLIPHWHSIAGLARARHWHWQDRALRLGHVVTRAPLPVSSAPSDTIMLGGRGSDSAWRRLQ